MEVHLSAEKEAQLASLAAAQGRDADLLVQTIVHEYLEATAHFIEAVRIGEADFEQGNYLTQAEVEARMATWKE